MHYKSESSQLKCYSCLAILDSLLRLQIRHWLPHILICSSYLLNCLWQPSSCLASENNCVYEACVGRHSLLLMFTNNYHRNCMHIRVNSCWQNCAFSFDDLQQIHHYLVLTSSQALLSHQWVISLPVVTLLPTKMYVFLLTLHPAHRFHFHTTFTTIRLLTDDDVLHQKTLHHTTVMRLEVMST
jgi:hypothetical protein